MTKANYAIKPTPEQALGTSRTQRPARLIAALGFFRGFGGSWRSVEVAPGYKVPSNYVGPALNPAIRELFHSLEEAGFVVSCPPSKLGVGETNSRTISVRFNGRKIGYFNSTVAKDGAIGLEFSKDGKRTGALNEKEAPGVVSELYRRHGLKSSDVVVQSGKGEKSKNRYVVLVSPNIALRVLKAEVGV